MTDKTGDDYESLTLPDMINRLNGKPLKYEVGTHQYSNLGYSLVTAVIEKVSGQSYEEFLRKEFFQSLGMDHTGYLLPEYTDNEVAYGYSKEGNWGQSHKKNWAPDGPYWNLRGNGGILSNVSDMAKWIKALHDNRVFSNKEKQDYFGRYVQEYPDMLSFYGYSWVGEDVSDTRRLMWHNGSNGVFTAEVRYYPEDDVFFIAVSNRSDSPVWHISEPIHEIIAGHK